ncbi:MAG TPA: glycosyltransferase [Tepidisphaeraceae bacterium]
MPRRLKILICAYACSPARGSEAGVGWGWVEAISKHHDVWVITGESEPFPDGIYRYKNEIETELERRPELRERMQFHHIPKRRWMWLEKIWPPSYQWFYRPWQRRAYRLARQLDEKIHFDVAHQLTYVGFRAPGYLWKLEVPLVWGPIGGLENTPWRFLPMLGIYGCVYYAARNVVNILHKRFLSAPKRAFVKASGGIIAATAGMQREILKWYGQQSEVICEIGMPATVATKHSQREAGEPLKIAWSGMHLSGKALPILLKALATLPADFPWELTILGQGPCTAKWRRLADRLGLSRRCDWRGWMTRNDAMQSMQSAHVFVITSIKDLTSTVLLEALAAGVPVICPNLCGFANVITDNCGIKLPAHSPTQMQRDLAAAIVRLANDETERRRLAEDAMLRSRDFSWERKATAVDAIYRRLIHQASEPVQPIEQIRAIAA